MSPRTRIPSLRPPLLAALALSALCLAAAPALRAATSFASPPDSNNDLQSISVTVSGLDGACPLAQGTVTLTFTGGSNDQYNNQQISVYGEILSSADDGSCDGFTATCDPYAADPDPAWWVIEKNTSGEANGSGTAAVDPGTDNCSEDSGTWPNNGGWANPTADNLSYTGQTLTDTFAVEVPATALPGQTYYLELGVNFGNYQDQTGASEGYVCLPFTVGGTCPSPTPTATPFSGTATSTPTPTESQVPGSPTQTPTPTESLVPGTATQTPTPTESSVPGTTTQTPTPTESSVPGTTTSTPTPTESPAMGSLTQTPTWTQTAQPLTPQPTGPFTMRVFPNFVRGTGPMNVLIQSGGGGVVTVRVLRQNGQVLRSLYQDYMAAGAEPTLVWDTNGADGLPAASGVYYIVATEGVGGHSIVRKALVVR